LSLYDVGHVAGRAAVLVAEVGRAEIRRSSAKHDGDRDGFTRRDVHGVADAACYCCAGTV